MEGDGEDNYDKVFRLGWALLGMTNHCEQL